MDCSTFSFDLHVLGAPPALILSRDQTLIEKCRVILLQLYSEILTSSSLLHPTRLSKICAAVLRHLSSGRDDCRPRNLFATSPFYIRTRDGNLGLKKEPNRKAVFRSAQWPVPSFVTIPSIEGFFTLYHPRAHNTSAHVK